MSRRVNRPLKRDTRPKGAEIDLGLAVSGALLPAGQIRSLPELAAYAGCTKQQIHAIERKALVKLRRRLQIKGIFSLLQTEQTRTTGALGCGDPDVNHPTFYHPDFMHGY